MSNSDYVIVESNCGPVKGDRRKSAMGDDYVNFQGIPYMKAPVGELRFRAPEPREKWTEVFDATKDCPQYKLVNPYDNGNVFGEEDAGCVNIFTKNTKPKKLFPVMVYVS
jgi:carboxylesterase type B